MSRYSKQEQSGLHSTKRQEKSADSDWSSDFSCISCTYASSKYPRRTKIFHCFTIYHSITHPSSAALSRGTS